MKKFEYISLLKDVRKGDLANVGGKAANLGELIKAGLPMAYGFVLNTKAYDLYIEHNRLGDKIGKLVKKKRRGIADLEKVAKEIKRLFLSGGLPDEINAELLELYEGETVAVRSSATAEDLPGASFAGQHETYLNVEGQAAVVRAVKKCWASLWTARAIAYREKQEIEHEGVKLAVVVQEMIESEVSGILFTANPGGAKDEMMVSSSWGLGEAVVGGLVSPDNFVINRKGRIVSREISDKRKMIVGVKSGVLEKPVPMKKRKMVSLKDDELRELGRLGRRIEKYFGMPMDVEWALEGGEFVILQARPITVFGPEWKMDKGFWAARASIAELMPTPLSPLFESVAGNAVVTSLLKLFKVFFKGDVMGRRNVKFKTVNGYAYYAYKFGFKEIFLLLVKSFGFLPRLSRVAISSWNKEKIGYGKLVKKFEGMSLKKMSDDEILKGIGQIVYMAAKYYTNVQMVMAMAMMGEFGFTWFYEKFVQKKRDVKAPMFLLGYDSQPIKGEKFLFDLAKWCLRDKALVRFLKKSENENLLLWFKRGVPVGVEMGSWREFRRQVKSYLKNYGHVIYDFDFINSVMADDPGVVFDSLRYYLMGKGQDPHKRQMEAVKVREKAEEKMLERLGFLRRWIFRKLLKWAQKYAPLREDSLAAMGLGWPKVREMIDELGGRLIGRGVLKERGDIYFLKKGEVLKAGKKLQMLVLERKKLREKQLSITPPAILPEKAKFFGIDISKWMPMVGGNEEGNVIKGIGASGGRVKGVARVILGPEDFGKLKPGEILVASITTPAWTPLFSIAAGVVTEVGGPLSHSSIVAREYGIPAVLGTGVATKRIKDGSVVVVDGEKGIVRLTG